LYGLEMTDLDGLTFGIRATSVGEDRDDSVKLVSQFDVPPAEEDDGSTGGGDDTTGGGDDTTGGGDDTTGGGDDTTGGGDDTTGGGDDTTGGGDDTTGGGDDTTGGGDDTTGGGDDTTGGGDTGGGSDDVVGDSFPDLYQDISHATYYIDAEPSTPEFELYTVRVENFPDSESIKWVANDLDDGREPPLYQLVWNEIKAEDPSLAGGKLLGVSVAGVDGYQEQYFALDGTVESNPAPTADGELVTEASQTVDYGYLFS
jgi:hypothetical protein